MNQAWLGRFATCCMADAAPPSAADEHIALGVAAIKQATAADKAGQHRAAVAAYKSGAAAFMAAHAATVNEDDRPALMKRVLQFVKRAEKVQAMAVAAEAAASLAGGAFDEPQGPAAPAPPRSAAAAAVAEPPPPTYGVGTFVAPKRANGSEKKLGDRSEMTDEELAFLMGGDIDGGDEEGGDAGPDAPSRVESPEASFDTLEPTPPADPAQAFAAAVAAAGVRCTAGHQLLPFSTPQPGYEC